MSKRQARALSIRRPDDFHHHFRDVNDGRLQTVAPLAAAQFARCVAMPNLVPPVTTVPQALAYRERIMAAVPEARRAGFSVLMTLYLTDKTSPADIEEVAQSEGAVLGCKLYPAGATTNSHFGVTSLANVRPALLRMAELNVPLLVHGEVVDPAVDPFDREAVFLTRELAPLLAELPALRVVLEHVTTKEAVDFVLAHGPNVAATITPQHLLYDRSALFQGGLRPHLYCLPILKRGNPHRLALLEAIKSGSPKFFLGTDSAPHLGADKEKDCGCAGCFSAPLAMELYAEAFEQVDALEHLEAFACHNGADFYGLPRNAEQVRAVLEPRARDIPKSYAVQGSESGIVPLRAGLQTSWTLEL
jgi:dihydroorotase